MSECGDRWANPRVILVATDLSDLDRLMPYAIEQAAETGARLILLHVLASTAAMSVDAAGMPYYNLTGVVESAETILLEWSERARLKSVVCEAVVREGNPKEHVIAAMRQFDADRILMGTRSRSRIGKLLIGSVAEQVLRSVSIPVMTVGPEAHLPEEIGGRNRVVLNATSLRETSSPSAALACSIAASQKAKLVLLHVLPPADEMERQGLPTGIDSMAMNRLRELAKATGAGCCAAVEPMVIHGNPFIEILSESVELHASLIVLGATHRSAFENFTRDRIIYRVLAHARCPVLTLREPLAEVAEKTDTERTASARR
jgi:nucleotide-binding universal stress UspA family protein